MGPVSFTPLSSLLPTLTHKLTPPQQRSAPLPSAQTESARELRRAFFCEMCQKGYARINEFEAHENSYDHQHRKRLKEMKALTRNPTAAVRDVRAEKKRRENEGMLSGNLQSVEKDGGGAAVGGRPVNAVGFRDAMVTKAPVGGTGTGAGAGAGEVRGFASEREAQRSAAQKEESEKVVRPPLWNELDGFYSLVDAAALPREMQEEELQLPWGGIWSEEAEMKRLLEAFEGEVEGLENGQARWGLMRALEDMSEGSEVDELEDELCV